MDGAAPANAVSSRVSVDLTTEVRWFFDGPLPPNVLAWFTRGGVAGFCEDRRDVYRLDGQVDVGVKRRAEVLLELKLRMGPPERFVIGAGLDGWLETWQRWSPADGRVHVGQDGNGSSAPSLVWCEVEKVVVKRRFDPGGVEIPLTQETRGMAGQGCDVEVATAVVEGRRAWTFAFAAFGAGVDHRAMIESAWAALVCDHRPPTGLWLAGPDSFGYPQWLVRMTATPPAVGERAIRSGAVR